MPIFLDKTFEIAKTRGSKRPPLGPRVRGRGSIGPVAFPSHKPLISGEAFTLTLVPWSYNQGVGSVAYTLFYLLLVFPPAFVEILVEKWLFMKFFRNNFSTSGLILNRFSGTPSGCEYASVDI